MCNSEHDVSLGTDPENPVPVELSDPPMLLMPFSGEHFLAHEPSYGLLACDNTRCYKWAWGTQEGWEVGFGVKCSLNESPMQNVFC